MLKNIIRIILGTLSVFIIYKYLRTYDFSFLRLIGWKSIVPAFAAVYAAMLLAVFYEKYIIRTCNIFLPFKKIIPIFIAIQLIGRLRIGIFGPFAALYWRKEIANITYKQSLLIMFVDNVLKFVVLCALSTIVIFSNVRRHCPGALPFALVAIGLFFSVFIVKHNLKIPGNPLMRVYKKLRSLSGKNLIFSWAIYILDSFLCAVVYFVLLQSFNYSPNIFLLWGINAASILIGILSFIPMGLGTQDITSLSLLMMMGIEKNAALTCVLLYRFFCTIIPLATLLIFGNIFLWKRKLMPRHGENG